MEACEKIYCCDRGENDNTLTTFTIKELMS